MSITLFIIGVTVIVSILAFQNAELFNRLKFNAYMIRHQGQWWRFLSYSIVHADWLHLIINMYVFYSFGKMVESIYFNLFAFKGMLYYLLLYVGGLLFSTVFDFGKHKDDAYYNAVGASGAVSAVVFSSIMLHPSGSIFLFPFPFPIPSWIFGLLYLAYSAYMGRRGHSNIGHFAHFWGAVFGIVFTLLTVPGVMSGFLSVF
jgi:membrane associated rhomboid family serine protease